MRRFIFEALKWLPAISLVVNILIARSVAKEISENGKSSRSFLKLLVWIVIVLALYVTAME